MKVTILGACPGKSGGSGFSASGNLLQTEQGVTMVVDYGIGYERLKDSSGNTQRAVTPKSVSNLEKIDYILLTHRHNDHSGMVPWLMKKFPKATLITTLPTFHFLGSSWSDLARMARIFDYPGLVPYDIALHEDIRKRTILVTRPGWMHLERGVRVYFNSNGHTRGSAYIVVEADGKRVGFSGDVSTSDTPTLAGMSPWNVPPEIRGLDLLFLESTHGNRNIEPRHLVVDYMNDVVKHTLRRGGLSLAIALGGDRAIDIALDQAQSGIKPCLDGGLPGHAWEVYHSPEGYWCPNDVRINPELSERVTPLFERNNALESMLRSGNAYSVVASAGSLQGGQSVKWAEKILPDHRSLILQCNFQFEGTPGAELEKLDRGEILMLKGKPVQVNCDVVRVEASAHAGANQLLRVASWFDARRIALYHGSWHSRSTLRGRLAKRYETSIPLNNDVIDI